ncbi:hypothetical protein O3G_MSEX014155 [Manduca sexta]|uniref:Uncharacterized protein n=1 Tax=Manduca sexta TaxID=7130 RepID=A0A921ZU00_MANSE|nr:hypothetical protein O3G_MSEX014155 [Manduca sexta]
MVAFKKFIRRAPTRPRPVCQLHCFETEPRRDGDVFGILLLGRTDFFLTEFRPRRQDQPSSQEILQCISVCAVHKCTLCSFTIIVIVDRSGERPRAGPTALRAFRGTGISHCRLPDSGP